MISTSSDKSIRANIQTENRSIMRRCTDNVINWSLSPCSFGIHVYYRYQISEIYYRQMKGEKSEEQENPFSLIYQSSAVQGECLLQKVIPIKRNIPLFILFVCFAIIFIGFPLLLTYWYPRLKKVFYFTECDLSQCSHFYIENYDNQVTYSGKQEQKFYENQNKYKRTITFMNRYMKYLVDQQAKTVKAAQFEYENLVLQAMKNGSNGLNPKSIAYLQQSYGKGTMIIKRENIFILFLQQIMRPLYLFIIFSCSLWIYQNYYYYAGIVIVTASIGIIINLYQTYELNKKMYDMAYHQIDVNVLRNGKVYGISSLYLVPGDIIFFEQGLQIKVPFDGVILEGSVLINECALTGQSVPVIKKSLGEGQKDLKNSLLFEGTTIIQVNSKKKINHFQKYRQKYGLPIYVVRTNFSTLKGQLIRIISFPFEKQNIFEKESSKFLLFLFCLSVISYLILIIKLHSFVEASDLVVKFLDLITITVPPGLPVSMTFGVIFALEKLKKKDIYCISPNKVVSGGMIDFLCFDKTGTLTEDYMDFHEFVPCANKKFQPAIENNQQLNNFQKIIKDAESKSPHLLLSLNNMAVNHSLIKVEEKNQIVGDPMQKKLFQFGEFYNTNEYNEYPQIYFAFDSNRKHSGQVYKRFEFDAQLLRMSTIAKTNLTGDNYYLYTKGSPETMTKIMLDNTIPSNYFQILKDYASMGFRVLAIAYKRIDKQDFKQTRYEIENKLIFNGFQIFQNRLKPETRPTIKEFIEAEIPSVMITGDNSLTASNIGYQCKILSLNQPTFIVDFKNNTFFEEEFKYIPTQKQKQQNNIYFGDEQNPIELVDFRKSMLQEKLIDETKNTFGLEEVLQKIEKVKGQICLTGNAFNILFEGQLQQISQVQFNLIKNTKIFARAKPNDKTKIIKVYKKLGKIVAMCGDGANDSGALKQANIGLSLSESQGLSAPFTSKVTNISSMVELLKQCQAGLATNFSLFNIMALYSLIQYSSVVICQFYFAYPSDFQFLYWDMFCNFLFFLTFGYTQTAQDLSNQKPKSSLFSLSNIIKVLVMFLLQLIGQILMIIGLSQFFATQINYDSIGSEEVNYQKYQIDNDFILDTPQTNILFLFTTLMYISTLLAFSISKPWRKQFYTNIPFMIVFLFTFAYSVVIIVVPQARLVIFEISYMSYQPLNYYVLGMALGFGIIIYVVQKFVLQPLFRYIQHKYPNKKWI